MRRLLTGAALAASLLIGLAAPAMAIQGDYQNDFDHPFVGLIAFYDASGVFQHRCTGELLAPDVVLTAGHCTDNGAGGVENNARIWFLQDVGSHFDGTVDAVTGYPNSCTGTDGNGTGLWCATSHQMYNYGFNNFAGFPEIHDVGIVILDQPVSGLGQASLATAGSVDTLQNHRGVQDPTMRVSGYGISYSLNTPAGGKGQGNGQQVSVSFRLRLEGDMTFIGLNATYSGGFTIKANGNGNNQANTCSGDSGGPVFWPSTRNRVVAVTSWGISNAGCRGDGYYYRTDQAAVLAWIQATVGPARWSQITVN